MPRKDEKPGLSHYLGVMLTSGSNTEIAMAARQAQKLLKAEGLRWHVVPEALEQRGKLLEAAKKLKTERDELKTERDEAVAERDRLRQLQQVNGAGNSFANQLWAPAGTPLSVDNRHAQWLLDLQLQGKIRLMEDEEGLVNSCARRRKLSERQQDWLRDIVKKKARLTGLTPPP